MIFGEEEAAIAGMAGEARELNQHYRHGDSKEECDADRAANAVGLRECGTGRGRDGTQLTSGSPPPPGKKRGQVHLSVAADCFRGRARVERLRS